MKHAYISLRKTICDASTELISKIQKKLFFLGFYNSDFLEELSNETKEAIINYQVKNNLPIGQLDEEIVRHILEQKTPFNK